VTRLISNSIRELPDAPDRATTNGSSFDHEPGAPRPRSTSVTAANNGFSFSPSGWLRSRPHKGENTGHAEGEDDFHRQSRAEIVTGCKLAPPGI
jgi:hypothetical protein